MTLTDIIGPIGGAEHVAMDLAGGLDPDRFESTACVTREPAEPAMAAAQENALRELAERGVHVLRLERTSRGELRPWLRLHAALRENRVDVLHAHSFGSNVWASLLGPAARVPVLIAHEHTWSYEGEPLRKLLDRHLIARAADVMVAVSHEDRRRMIEIEGIPPDKIRYLPNAAPAAEPADAASARSALGLPRDAFVVGSIGLLRPQKAFDILIEAATVLRQRVPNLRVVIIGEGEERASLEAQIARNGVEDVVQLAGLRQGAGRLASAFDVAVCCSDFEGMPLSVLEYMTAGRPVVATRVGANPDLVVDGLTGLLVPRRDPAALVDALWPLATDGERREALGRASRDRAQAKFAASAMVDRVQDLYGELLTERVLR